MQREYFIGWYQLRYLTLGNAVADIEFIRDMIILPTMKPLDK